MTSTRSSRVSRPSYPAPRHGTERRPGWATFGDDVARWHLIVNRKHLMPHQRLIADVAGELDPATGLRWYDTVVIKMPRQNGKTNLVEAQMMAASRRHDAGNAVRRTVVYTAQDRLMARERLIVDLVEAKLDDNPVLRGRFTCRKSNGSERITWRDTRSRILVQASTDTAGHSLTVDDGIIDEAFAHDDLTLVTALQPTMLTRPDPQLWIVSTPGDGTDGLLLHYEEVGAVSLSDPDTRVAFFDWSATEDDDRTDPAVWRRVMPALGVTITEDRVRSYLATTGLAEFDRAYLARRPPRALIAGLDVVAWHDCANTTGRPLDPAGPVVIGIDLNPARTHSTIAVAFKAPQERCGVVIDRQPGTHWVPGAVEAIANRPGITVYDVWADRQAGAGGIIDAIAGRGRAVHELSGGDVASAAGTLYDLTLDRKMTHDAQPDLDDAVTGARRRRLGEVWALSKLESTADVSPATAVSFALAGYLQHFPAGLDLAGIH